MTQPRTEDGRIRSTTVLAVLRDGRGAIGSDGQVTLGNTAVKHGAVKVRALFQDRVLVGFAGGAADAFTLFEKFEGHLERYRGHLRRATVELAREWRTDRFLRRLEAMMVVMDRNDIFIVSGNGDVIESDHGVTAIGSGGPYALAAARALVEHTDLDAATVCRAALGLAGEICIYTNQRITVLALDEAGVTPQTPAAPPEEGEAP
ncbi:MAG: ATP-dependent protease subunit HslV [Candidatus Krumholzibacteriia bacterium]